MIQSKTVLSLELSAFSLARVNNPGWGRTEQCQGCLANSLTISLPRVSLKVIIPPTLYINSSPTISNYHNDKPGSFPKAHGQICSLPRDWQWLLRGKSEGKHSTDSDKNDCMLAVHPRIKKKIPITILELPGKYPIVHELKLATSLKTWNNKRSASIEYPGHFYLSKTWTFFIAQLKMHVSQKSSLLPPGKSVMPIPKKKYHVNSTAEIAVWCKDQRGLFPEQSADYSSTGP